MRVKRVVFVNRAPFGNVNLDFSGTNVVSLTGINGAGKTTILSYIADAFYEIARNIFHQEFIGKRQDNYYRIISPIFNTMGTSASMVYILLEYNGKSIHYVDFVGLSNEHTFVKLMSSVWDAKKEEEWDIKYKDIVSKSGKNNDSIKYIKCDNADAKEMFLNNIAVYFPSYRYEQPGYLNDVYKMELSYRMKSDVNGRLTNPIEVVSDLNQIANWIMDIVLDNTIYKDRDPTGHMLKNNMDDLITGILTSKFHEKMRLGIGLRNMGGARIQIAYSRNGETAYPSVFNISAGESALLCLFGELMRQADRIEKTNTTVEGVVLIDEIDKHLHITLQKDVLPTLIGMFPNVQFIFSTHSPFVNIGLMEKMNETCRVIDLDNGCRECSANENIVFAEAYDTMIRENENYRKLLKSVSDQLKDITKIYVFLEGITDEKYFNKAISAYNYNINNICFRSIGHYNENGTEEFAGKDNMDKAIQFVKGLPEKQLCIFVFDCDTEKEEYNRNNIVVKVLKKQNSNSRIKVGIENALVLDDIDLNQFYEEKKTEDKYGAVNIIRKFKKTELCNHICNLDIELQKKIFINIKNAIDEIIEIVNRVQNE